MPALAWDPPSEFKGEYGKTWSDERIKPPPAPITHQAYMGVPLGFTPVQPPLIPPPGSGLMIGPVIKPPTVITPASTTPTIQPAPSPTETTPASPTQVTPTPAPTPAPTPTNTISPPQGNKPTIPPGKQKKLVLPNTTLGK